MTHNERIISWWDAMRLLKRQISHNEKFISLWDVYRFMTRRKESQFEMQTIRSAGWVDQENTLNLGWIYHVVWEMDLKPMHTIQMKKNIFLVGWLQIIFSILDSDIFLFNLKWAIRLNMNESVLKYVTVCVLSLFLELNPRDERFNKIYHF